jgi:hypothetical protein
MDSPWYRDGLVWSVLGFIVIGFLIGLIAGQYIDI